MSSYRRMPLQVRPQNYYYPTDAAQDKVEQAYNDKMSKVNFRIDRQDIHLMSFLGQDYNGENKSTKGASKRRRDQINGEIHNLKDLLPLPPATRQRLSQLQLMALVCVYVRKSTYFNKTFQSLLDNELQITQFIKNVSFTKALSGFLIMMTQHGKLLYISDNAAEYLGHSMEDLLISGDSVYDIIDSKDHQVIRDTLEVSKGMSALNTERREFLCRINVNKGNRRQMRFGDQKLVLVSGHYFSYIPLSSSEVPVFIAHCSPLVMPETRECVSQGNCLVYSSMHSVDLKYVHLDRSGEFHLGVDQSTILAKQMSFYEFIHPQDLEEVSKKHLALTAPNSTEKSAILLIRMQSSVYASQKPFCWTHVVMQLKEPTENGQASLIINTIQILTDRETRVLRQNKWLYEHYSIHAKMQYGLTLGNAQFAKLSYSQSSDNGSNSSQNSSSSLSQMVMNSSHMSNGHRIKRSRSSNSSPVNGHPYMFAHHQHSQQNRSRLSSPVEHQLNCNTQHGLPSPTTAASIAAISPAMPNAKSAVDSKYPLTNENSNSSTNLTSEAYLTANSNYGINSLSPTDQTAHHSSALHHAAAAALNPIAPLNVNGSAVTPFHAHNLLQYSPQAGTLATYPSFASPVNSTSLFTHSPQHASSVITNTTPPATPPETVHKYSCSSNNSSLNSNSSSHNGSSNKRSLNSSSGSSSNARSSPEPKRAYLGQNAASSFSHYNNNGYTGFNHYTTYNVNINVNSQTTGSQLPAKKLAISQQADSQVGSQVFNHHAAGQTSGQQYSSFANRWLPISANSFSDLMPSMSNYYNAAAAHSTHQLNQLAQQQLSNAAHQILPNINVSNHSTINQRYHHHLNYHSHSFAGQKLNNLFAGKDRMLDQHLAAQQEEVSNSIALY